MDKTEVRKGETHIRVNELLKDIQELKRLTQVRLDIQVLLKQLKYITTE